MSPPFASVLMKGEVATEADERIVVPDYGTGGLTTF
jgi:hypothetical protein